MNIQTYLCLRVRLASLLLGLVTILPVSAAESVPPLVNYQGTLTDANGAPMAGVKSMEFNLFDAPTGGNRIWGPQIYATVPLIGGKFNVLLGPTDSGGKLITTAFADKTRYLSITIEGKEIVPRQQILSTPFAIQSQETIHAQDATHAQNADKAELSENWAKENSKLTNLGVMCRNIETPNNEGGGGNLFFLDRHNLECADNEYLKKFYLNRTGDNHFKLIGRCCRLWP